jgi:hypothetical protein
MESLGALPGMGSLGGVSQEWSPWEESPRNGVPGAGPQGALPGMGAPRRVPWELSQAAQSLHSCPEVPGLPLGSQGLAVEAKVEPGFSAKRPFGSPGLWGLAKCAYPRICIALANRRVASLKIQAPNIKADWLRTPESSSSGAKVVVLGQSGRFGLIRLHIWGLDFQRSDPSVRQGYGDWRNMHIRESA